MRKRLAQRERFRASLDRFYQTFVSRVSAGRRAPFDSVEVHARGRVWTGAAALERGLVDRIGSVEDAVARVRVLTASPAVRRMDARILPRVPLLTRLVRRLLLTASPTLLSRVSDELEAVEGLSRALASGQALAWAPWESEP